MFAHFKSNKNVFYYITSVDVVKYNVMHVIALADVLSIFRDKKYSKVHFLNKMYVI